MRLFRISSLLSVIVALAFSCQAAFAHKEGLKGSDGHAEAESKAHCSVAHPQLGMELWTYRHQAAVDLPGTLATIRKLGLTTIETSGFYGRSALEFRRLLNRTGLTCAAIIVGYGRLEKDFPGVVSDARTVGARYVVTAGFPHHNPLTPEDVRRAAANFNIWGAKLKRLGLQFGYHPHGFEFVPYGTGTLFDFLLAETNNKTVGYELDTYHFVRGGADPVRYLKKYPCRFILGHLKDMAKGTPTGWRYADVKVGKTSVVLGTGTVNFPAFFAAARKSAIRIYYIEDESPFVRAQVPKSLDYLKPFKMWQFLDR